MLKIKWFLTWTNSPHYWSLTTLNILLNVFYTSHRNTHTHGAPPPQTRSASPTPRCQAQIALVMTTAMRIQHDATHLLLSQEKYITRAHYFRAFIDPLRMLHYYRQCIEQNHPTMNVKGTFSNKEKKQCAFSNLQENHNQNHHHRWERKQKPSCLCENPSLRTPEKWSRLGERGRTHDWIVGLKCRFSKQIEIFFPI